MPWDRNRPPDAKYRSKQHRDYRASLVAQLKQQGYLICTAEPCVLDTRTITNPNGRARDGLHAGHNADGTTYVGAQHNACNVRDGAARGRAKQIDQGDAKPWLARDNHPCPVCNTTVTWASQRTCSKECSALLRKSGRPTPQPQRCALCGATFAGRKRRYCGEPCRLEVGARAMRDKYRESVGLPVDPTQPTRPTRPRDRLIL